jgi:uncharacterized protein (TIGR03083 family)
MRTTSTEELTFDAVVVGARCAGAPVAIRLALAGWRVAVVDKAHFPSDVLSTHVIFPDGLARLDELGVLKELERRHDIVMSRYSWRVLGHEVAGTFTPIEGQARAVSVRRITLDAVLVDVAGQAGATMVLGRKVTGLIGSGSLDDPVRGVVLDDGRRLTARWVVGADGRHSSVAHHLGLERTDERAGELAFLLGYWRGLPASDWIRLDMHERSALMAAPCEDGIHLLTVAGPPNLTRGTPEALEARYRAALLEFPAVLNSRLLDAADLVGPVVGAPETMMRGYYRTANGPGWALVGDAGHVTHPTTGQGIGDALAEAEYVTDDLLRCGRLDGYERWREHRSAEAYEFSFRAARPPQPSTAGRYAGLAADPVARQQFLDTFTRRTHLADVFTRERSRRWRAASAYEDGLHRTVALVDDLAPSEGDRTVPACPLWSVRDLVAHLCGVAEDATRGQFFDGATRAWADPELAARREAWTAHQVESRRGLDLDQLVADLQRHGAALVRALRRGDPRATEVPSWMIGAAAGDLAVHLDDLREAVGRPAEPDAPITEYGFRAYRSWLAQRITAWRLSPLRLTDGGTEWRLGGEAEPAATLEADAVALFRAISGRRPLDEVTTWSWHGDPAAYLPILSPYPAS